ncbi:MAG: carboxylesterase family protein [Rikenellaceae bacterium]|nr:carboxylesterase family protein [Rikenellaceae bacterium]
MKIWITLAGMVFLLHAATAQENYAFQKETHTFAQRQGQTLWLDRYTAIDRPEGKTPCLLFVFGGAFARGARDVEKYMPYFEYFVQNGFTVVSIDYRLGLKEISQRPDATLPEFYQQFREAVDMAVEDLFEATRFILRQADPWNIDPSMIITNGSSAGAVTVLQAEYILRNDLQKAALLPSDFRYAGVISFAGAIFVEEGLFRWNSAPAPMLLLHGDADLQVPYSVLTYEQSGFYGANAIADALEEWPAPFKFISFEDYGHEIASDPMKDSKEEVLGFIHEFVFEQQPLQVRAV